MTPTYTTGNAPVTNPTRFLGKLFIFVVPPVILFASCILLTPLNFFTFRAWEALRPYELKFSGYFYPLQSLTLTEVGDLGVGSEYAVPKDVTFITDAYGLRFDSSAYPNEMYDIVIVGDSLVAGSSLTQEDTVAVVLSKQLDLIAYPYAPRSIGHLLSDPRFITSPPDSVILVSLEHYINDGLCPRDVFWRENTDNISHPLPLKLYWDVYIDQIRRYPTYAINYWKARSSERDYIANDNHMFFYEMAIMSPPLERIPNIVASLKRCSDWFETQSIEFIFVPIPDRENIYFDSIPDSYKPSGVTHEQRRQFLEQLIEELQANDVSVIDVLSAFEEMRDTGMNPYHVDDTHWNPAGVHRVVELLSQHVTVR